MTEIQNNEVLGFYIADKLYCLNCKPVDIEIKYDDVFLNGDRFPNVLYFCDKCEREI